MKFIHFQTATLGLMLSASLLTTLVRGQTQQGDSSTSPADAVSIVVDASQQEGELRRIWRFFGADEPNYAYMKDGRKLLRQLGELAPRQTFFRTHNLMTSGPGAPALKWGSTNLAFELPRQGVSLLVLSYRDQTTN